MDEDVYGGRTNGDADVREDIGISCHSRRDRVIREEQSEEEEGEREGEHHGGGSGTKANPT